MPRFQVGDRVVCLYRPPKADPRTPTQQGDAGEYIGGRDSRGQRLFKPDSGAGSFQSGPPPEGTVLEVQETARGTQYLVRVMLSSKHHDAHGPYEIPSARKRVIPEDRLVAVGEPLPPDLQAWIAATA